MSEEFKNAKESLFIELNVHFNSLIRFLQGIPVNEQFKGFAFQNLDQGIFWIQKGIELMQLPPPPVVNEKVAEENIRKESPPVTDSCS